MAGRRAAVEPLILITGDDFKWAYTWMPNGSQAPFPPNRELYYEFKNGTGGAWSGSLKWVYTISGAVASIRVESEIADTITNRTPYRLVFRDKGASPTDKSVMIIGNVERQEPR
ncbi:DUF7264 domain-containing protein [Nocardia arthritidis]|uniref:LtfC-like domain-containing protein n=1 Tax=Nocardia arthritidis TaxID=228602 RepID=UPI003D161FA3